MSRYPEFRPRRLRRTEALRNLVREARLSPADLILPLFVTEGEGIRRPVSSMPGVAQTSVDEVLADVEEARDLGIAAVLLFGIPDRKDEVGSSGLDDNGVVQRATRSIKKMFPQMLVVTDVCLCEYTSHGHCGVLDGADVDNDQTLPLLARMAVSHARAGADIVAPSDMMDGRVGEIRGALDANGFTDVSILAYSAKYASAFYGPFREAAESTPQFGDRKTYQMDPGNAEEALREVWQDIEEGADMIMVKPALPYLDIVRRVKDDTRYPVCAYHVSGEFAMIMAAGERGWLDAERAMEESLLSIRRAGADMIITYWARQYARKVQR
jgi:porphobilinogen synthase